MDNFEVLGDVIVMGYCERLFHFVEGDHGDVAEFAATFPEVIYFYAYLKEA